jgi:NitT/TauT family transport system ATP-binding protein
MTALAAPTSGTPQVMLDDVSVDYGGVLAVDRLSFDVRPGQFVALIGPSGCGKTSALRAVGGLIRPSGGAVRVDGQVVTGPLPDRVTYVFQDLALFPWRSALRNVELALELRGVGRRERRAAALEMLHAVGLGDAVDRLPGQLSGGMRQRVALARALVSHADILLLDEPFAALDEQTRMVMGAQFLHLLEEYGKTVLFVTHSLDEAIYLSDLVVVLTARPARLKELIAVPLERPREPMMMRAQRFHALRDYLFSLLFEESSRAMESA